MRLVGNAIRSAVLDECNSFEEAVEELVALNSRCLTVIREHLALEGKGPFDAWLASAKRVEQVNLHFNRCYLVASSEVRTEYHRRWNAKVAAG